MGKSGAVNISSGLFLDQCFQSPSEGPISWFIQTQNSTPCCRWRESDVGLFMGVLQLWRPEEDVEIWAAERAVVKILDTSYQKIFTRLCSLTPRTAKHLKRRVKVVISHHRILGSNSFLWSEVWRTRSPLICLFKNTPSEHHKHHQWSTTPHFNSKTCRMQL